MLIDYNRTVKFGSLIQKDYSKYTSSFYLPETRSTGISFIYTKNTCGTLKGSKYLV